MNKAELASAIAADTGLSQTQANAALASALSSIEKSLANGDKVALAGFGNFSNNPRAARTGRNPQTGKEIQIPAKNVVKFKAAKALDEAVQ